MLRPPPRSTLFPYTRLFRSRVRVDRHVQPQHLARAEPVLVDVGVVDLRVQVGVDLSAKLLRDAGQEDLGQRSEEHTSELQSRLHLVCRLLLEKKKQTEKH